MVDLGCLGTALVEDLVGEMGLGTDDFAVVLEPEFTWVFVKVKGLGGRSTERADRFKQLFPSDIDT